MLRYVPGQKLLSDVHIYSLMDFGPDFPALQLQQLFLWPASTSWSYSCWWIGPNTTLGFLRWPQTGFAICFAKFIDIVVISVLVSRLCSNSFWRVHECDTRPGSILTHNAANGIVMTISVDLILSLFGSPILPALIEISFIHASPMHDTHTWNCLCSPEEWCSHNKLSSDAHCRAIAGFTTLAVNASHHILVISSVCKS